MGQEAEQGKGGPCEGWEPGWPARGASTTDVMLVAHYAAGATAERGAVARYL